MGPYKKNTDEREMKITIDKEDLWNVDVTLAEIIVPLLKAYKNHEIHVKPTHKELDAMIWTFEQVLSDGYFLGQYDEKQFNKGMKLFIKNYRRLWI